jgi:hypothetical protein
VAKETSEQQESEIKEKLAEFAAEMKPLDAEFAQVLHNNLWELYIQSGNKQELAPIPEDVYKEDVVSLSDWKLVQENNIFVSDDGDAFYGTETCFSNVSAFREEVPAWATHVILFGK